MPGRIVAFAPMDAPFRTTVFEELFRVNLAPREAVVGESCIRTDENVILNLYAVPQLHSGLDGNAITETDVILDEHAIADIAICTDPRSWQHVGEGPDTRAGTDLGALAQAFLMYETINAH